MKRIVTFIVILLVICLLVSVIFLGFIINFSSGDFGPAMGGDATIAYTTPFQTTNETTVHISMGYIPAKGVVLYCTYTITNNENKVIDSSIMVHLPFSSEYIIDKQLTNLANGKYTFVITAHYANGKVSTPANETFTVDTSFKYPMLAIISPANKTYNTNQVNITYYTNSRVIMSYYSLNDGNWTWFHGNTTLNELPNGSCKLDVFVVTEANRQINTANLSGSANFTVDSP